MPDSRAPGPRQAVRALVFDGDGRILLLRAHDWYVDGPWWWELPGGGIQAGEEHVEALRRELREETGLLDIEVGPARWTWRGVWHFGDRDIDQEDVVHVCRATTLRAIAPDLLPDEGVIDAAWVTSDDLRAQQRQGRATVPPDLARLADQAWRELQAGAGAGDLWPERIDVGTLPPGPTGQTGVAGPDR